MVTDADIDAIIAKGQRETDELNNKLKEYSENAMKFTMDGGALRTKMAHARLRVRLLAGRLPRLTVCPSLHQCLMV